MLFFPGDLDLYTRPSKGPDTSPCEFGANLFGSSRDISYTNKKTQTDGAKDRTFHSSLCVVNM